MSDKLYEPCSFGTLKCPNRLVMAPMTRYKSPGGVPGPGHQQGQQYDLSDSLHVSDS